MKEPKEIVLITKSVKTFNPVLAIMLGSNGEKKATLLSQIEYWIKLPNSPFKDGTHWTFHSMSEWHNLFPFWSESTIRRCLKYLKDNDLIITGTFNKWNADRTKWYTINQPKIDEMLHSDKALQIYHEHVHPINQSKSKTFDFGVNQSSPVVDNREASMLNAEIDKTRNKKLVDRNDELRKEAEKEAKKREKARNQSKEVKEVIEYLNQKLGTHFRANSKATQKLIKARLNEGYTVDDFKKVINNKINDWKNTKMGKYLRPLTLFNASKFDGYLNQQTNGRITGGQQYEYTDTSKFKNMEGGIY